jgi:hypothetical protein
MELLSLNTRGPAGGSGLLPKEGCFFMSVRKVCGSWLFRLLPGCSGAVLPEVTGAPCELLWLVEGLVPLRALLLLSVAHVCMGEAVGGGSRREEEEMSASLLGGTRIPMMVPGA